MKEYTVMFQTVSQIADFAVAANHQPFSVQFLYENATADAKSILSMCSLPLHTPIAVHIPDSAREDRFLAEIEPFLSKEQ